MPVNYYEFDKIYIEKKIKTIKEVKNILNRINNNPKVIYVDDVNRLIKSLPVVYHPQERSKNLLLSSIRGDILQKCPGSHGHICCNYYVINLYIGCPLNCAYCILQSYLNQPFTIINVDIKNIFKNLKQIVNNNKNQFFRIGTGELGDSLAYDYLTGFSGNFIEFFSGIKNTVFEFKTKTNFIDNLLLHNSPGNIVVGFSVNPEILINKIETNAINIDERLIAAGKLQNKGYKIALHFDPIVNIADFDIHYGRLIDDIFKYIKAENIAWISLGTFRYTPDLKNMIEYNYPDADLVYSEFIECNDKKYRYIMPVRIKLYERILSMLKAYKDNLPVYLCMENPYVWKRVLNGLPFESEVIGSIFKNQQD